MSDRAATPDESAALPQSAALPAPAVPELVAGPVSAAAAAAVEEPGAAAAAAARGRLIGFLLVLAATVGWSLSGIFMRLLEEPDPWRSNGYRGLSMALAMAGYLVWRYRGGLGALLRSTPPLAILLGGGFFTVGSTFYLVAFTLAPVANVAALGALAPLFAAALAWLFLRERTAPLVLVAVVVALGGVTVMVADQLALDGDAWLGQFVAIFVAFCFAGQTVALRRYRGVEMLPAFVLGGLLTAAVMLGLSSGLPSTHDLLLLGFMGVVQLALPIACYSRGARYLPAVTLALVALLDVVLNPLWAWLGVGEEPTLHTAIGALLIVGAVAGVALKR